MLTKKFYIPIGVCVLLVLAIGFLSLRSDIPEEPIVVIKTVPPDTQAVKVSKASADKETKKQVSSKGLLPVSEEQRTDNIANRDSKNAKPQGAMTQSMKTEAETENEIRLLLRKRDEIEQRLYELGKEIGAGAKELLKTSDERLSLMYAYLAKVPTKEREVVRQVLLARFPDDADSLNEFFDEIADAPTLSLSEISARARETLGSVEANKIAALQQQATSKQLWNEHREISEKIRQLRN